MNEKPISPLRRRMIEDMTVRNFVEKTHNDYIAHDVFLSVVSPTAELDAVRRGPAYGARQSLLMGLGTKGRLRFFSATASSLWGKAIDGLRAGDGPRTRILQARWDF